MNQVRPRFTTLSTCCYVSCNALYFISPVIRVSFVIQVVAQIDRGTMTRERVSDTPLPTGKIIGNYRDTCFYFTLCIGLSFMGTTNCSETVGEEGDGARRRRRTCSDLKKSQ